MKVKVCKEQAFLKSLSNRSQKRLFYFPVSNEAARGSKTVAEKENEGSKAKVDAEKVENRNKEDNNTEGEVLNKAGEFIVEAIRGKREIKGQTHFFIKWLGYPEFENTWEPICHLSGCRLMVQAYLKANPESGQSKKKASQLRNISEPDPTGKSTPKRPKTEYSAKKDNSTEILENKNQALGKSDENFEYDEKVALEKTKNYIEFDCSSNLPRDRTPKRLVHVTAFRGKLRYLIQWKTNAEDDNEEQEVDAENTSIVDGDSFRVQYPQLVIKFYEGRLHRIDPPDEKLIAERACSAMVKSKERKSRPNPEECDSSDEDMVDGEEEKASALDKFGFPVNLDSSSSESSDTE